MSNERYHHQDLIVGAAVIAGIVGTLSALMHSNRPVKNWKDQAKGIAYQVLEKREMVNRNMVLGGVAGGLIGAATALLLAPKAGSELIKDLTHPFSHRKKHARLRFSKSISRKLTSHKRKASRSSKAGMMHSEVTAKTKEQHKMHKTTRKRKSPTRRHAATTALKQAATALEKAVTNAKET